MGKLGNPLEAARRGREAAGIIGAQASRGRYTPLVRKPPSTTMVSPVVKLAESLMR